MPTNAPGLRLERRAATLEVTLDRPERLNALDAATARALRAALDEADHDPEVGAILLTGAGRGFCAGADVGDLVAMGGRPAAIRRDLLRDGGRLVTTLHALETPLVAAVNGPCAGAGVGLALACDVVVASESAGFTLSFIRRGLVPDYALTAVLPRLVGARLARELCLLGDTVRGPDAERLGLVTRCVPDEELLPTARDYADRLAAGPGVALGLTKRLLAADLDVAAAVEREFTAQALAFASDDFAEGAAAFLEKRPARFASR